VLVTASAVGFYGADRGDEILTEASGRGDGFLAEVVADWEQATAPAADGGLRVVQIRTGIVQSPRGAPCGCCTRCLPPDWEAAWDRAANGCRGSASTTLSTSTSGPCSTTRCRARSTRSLPPRSAISITPAPSPVSCTGRRCSRARFGPQLLLGREGARELAEASQRATPQRLVELDHPFRHPNWKAPCVICSDTTPAVPPPKTLRVPLACVLAHPSGNGAKRVSWCADSHCSNRRPTSPSRHDQRLAGHRGPRDRLALVSYGRWSPPAGAGGVRRPPRWRATWSTTCPRRHGGAGRCGFPSSSSRRTARR